MTIVLIFQEMLINFIEVQNRGSHGYEVTREIVIGIPCKVLTSRSFYEA